jgi:ribonuclease-3
MQHYLMTNENLEILCQHLGYQFKDLELLKRALTHRSYLNEAREDQPEHNERIEFLGDAVLELITTEHLFHKYPKRKEGELTSFRAALVRTESLAKASTELQLGDFILMSKGEEATGGRTRPYILANTFEAVLGAIFLDGGIESCKNFISTVLLPKLTDIVAKRLDIDAKSKLQEQAQEVYKYTPTYEVVAETGPDHDRTFTVKVVVAEEDYGTGSGKSKQEAEQQAAREALKKFKILN